MDFKLSRNWYFTKPEAISRYLVSVFRSWGYPVFWNRSDDSESVYLKVYVGTLDSPKTLHIRISNHSVPQKRLWIAFNFDVYGSYEREGAMSYIRLLSKIAEDLDKPFPAALERIKTGTQSYKSYMVEMQRRRKMADGRPHFFDDQRLYV